MVPTRSKYIIRVLSEHVQYNGRNKNLVHICVIKVRRCGLNVRDAQNNTGTINTQRCKQTDQYRDVNRGRNAQNKVSKMTRSPRLFKDRSHAHTHDKIYGSLFVDTCTCAYVRVCRHARESDR